MFTMTLQSFFLHIPFVVHCVTCDYSVLKNLHSVTAQNIVWMAMMNMDVNYLL